MGPRVVCVTLIFGFVFLEVQGECWEKANVTSRPEVTGVIQPRDLKQCQDSCVDHDSCSGIEWDSGFAPHVGTRCWLHRGLTSDVDYDHYELQPCQDGVEPVYPFGNGLPSCPTFTKTLHKASTGDGWSDEEVATLDSCKFVCLMADGCVGFDYYMGNSGWSVKKCKIFTNVVTNVRDTEYYKKVACAE